MQYEIKNLSQAEIDTFLISQKVGLLSLAGDTTPYAVPLAYSYDRGTIYLTIRPAGRKMDHISKNQHVCFVVYQIPEGFGMANMQWTSIICEGVLEQLVDRESIAQAVRAGEKHMGLPEGSWDKLVATTMQNPSNSGFWKINVQHASGKSM